MYSYSNSLEFYFNLKSKYYGSDDSDYDESDFSDSSDSVD